MPREFFPFRKRDELTGKWYRASWLASLEEIARNGWIVDGPGEIRADPDDARAYFKPYPSALRAQASNVEREPGLDRDERYLVLVFLRRYVAYCARRRRYAQMQGAAQLFRELRRNQCG